MLIELLTRGVMQIAMYIWTYGLPHTVTRLHLFAETFYGNMCSLTSLKRGCKEEAAQMSYFQLN